MIHMKAKDNELNSLNKSPFDQSIRKIAKSHLKMIVDSEYIFILMYSFQSVQCLFQEKVVVASVEQVCNGKAVCLFSE